MSRGRRKVILFLVIWCAVQLIMGICLFVLELFGYSQGSTLSKLVWSVWAEEPWVIFLVTHIMAVPWWFLMGHFAGQRRDVYESIRQEHRRSDADAS